MIISSQSFIDIWSEKWGKGFNLGFLEWDDGNRENGDGCDQDCKVERDWKCEQGDESSPDVWVSLVSPEAELGYIGRTSYLAFVVFSETVTFGQLNEGDIGINIEGPLSPYKFKYYINSSTGYDVGESRKRFSIKFEFLSSLAGNNQG